MALIPKKTLSFTPAALLGALAGTALGQSTDPFPAQFQLSSLLPANGGDGSTGFVLNGIDAFDKSGYSVSCAGDVNGDGVDDLIIGAWAADPHANSYAGESYVVFGGADVGSGGVINLSSLNGTNGFVINGVDASDLSGRFVSSAGDVNGDGIDELFIGAYAADPNGTNAAGESYVVFGAVGVGSGGVINLSSLNGTNGFVINGIDAGDLSGRSGSSAGDVNGDGIEDMIIGAYGADPNGTNVAGESYVVFGAARVGSGRVIELSSLDGTNGFVINGIDAGDRSGRSVSSAGDVNADGIDDLIIGAFLADPNSNSSAGESYVVFGAAGIGSEGVFELSSLNGTNGFVLNGIDASDYSGISVSSAGDVNGDGIGDLIIGARFADPNLNSSAGESYVVFGAAGVGSGGVIELSSLNGTNGFVLNGIDANDRSGHSVSSAGDVNGDGIDDLIIGAYLVDPNSNTSAGESYVVFGAAGMGSGGVFELSSLNGTNGFVLNGIHANDFSGRSVSSAGDVNADGIDDLIIGAAFADPNGISYAGESYVVFGRAVGQLDVWVNEFHYDNAGTDEDEFIEVAGVAGTDLTGWTLVLYNGATGLDYSTIDLAGPLPDTTGTGFGFQVVNLPTNELQNGGPDGIALVDATPTVKQFISYEGAFAALSGVANGMMSTDIGVSEPGMTMVGFSLQLTGTGCTAADFTWMAPNANTTGAANIGQTLEPCIVEPPFCAGDADGSGTVDFGDLNAVLGNWLNDYTPGTGPGDANLDGIVDFGDISRVLGKWLAVCPS